MRVGFPNGSPEKIECKIFVIFVLASGLKTLICIYSLTLIRVRGF